MWKFCKLTEKVVKNKKYIRFWSAIYNRYNFNMIGQNSRK